jgi:hypothetical protein
MLHSGLRDPRDTKLALPQVLLLPLQKFLSLPWGVASECQDPKITGSVLGLQALRVQKVTAFHAQGLDQLS